MATTRHVETQIWKLEEFRVKIRHLRGRDVRGDRQGLPSYPYERKMKHKATVSQWRQQRFRATYPGFQVDVLKADQTAAHGGTRLSTVRDTYL
jgi:hypothetical protein